MADEPKNEDFESREYQTELFEMALKKNLILYLPTGSGKTFIATLLLKEMCNVPDVKKPISEGGKRTFFLVNTVALVGQQGAQIRSQSTLSVGQYSGDMGVDLWAMSTWLEELNENQVLVMTCQIFLDLLLTGVITLKNANLIIFDECHRGVSNHPMRQVTQLFKAVAVEDQPRILGLTATLLNGNIKPHCVAEEIKTLENTFLATIATSLNEEMVKLYSTNPKENRLSYSENETSSICYQLRDRIFNQFLSLLESVEVDDPVKPHSKPAFTYQIDSNLKKINKRMKNLIVDIQVNMDDLGVYGGSLAMLAHIVQVQLMIPNAQLESSSLLYKAITADCVLLRKHLNDEMNRHALSDADKVRYFSSDKVKKLFDILKKLKPKDSAIVFVKRRFSAKILYYLLKRASRVDSRLKHIKSNFIVGYNVGNPFKDTRENYIQRSQNKKVMNQFNQGELNVLIASNVVEEGVDISQCNYVIMFDPPQDFRSYIQSKGRARDKNSNYIIMTSSSDSSFNSKYGSYREVESILKEILYGGKSRLRTSPSKDELDARLFVEKPGLEPYQPRGINGPTVTALSAISLINRYFAKLKYDKFTKVTPFWHIQEEHSKYKCFLQLPMESRVKGQLELSEVFLKCVERSLLIQLDMQFSSEVLCSQALQLLSSWQSSKLDAKRSAALEACKKLHASGELNDKTLLPEGDDVAINNVTFTPNRDDSEIFEEQMGDKTVKVGTNKYKRTCLKKWAECLSNCRPKPHQEVYLHVLDMKPIYSPPVDHHRLHVIHQMLSLPITFAILSAKKLPKLAPFPMYMSTGELEVNINDPQPVTLDEKQLQSILDFHCTIFDDVLAVAKKFMIRDFTNTQNAYLVAPVITGAFQKCCIDWEVMEQASRTFPSTEARPSKEERLNLKITDDNYLGKVVSPWYRNVPAQKYLVTKVCYDMSENTTFPTESYATYKEYFADKYKIEPLIMNQPLIEVRALSGRLNSTKPRALTKQLKRKHKDENEDFEVWLLPEYCVMYPLPGKYWLKSLLLPSVLHRVSQLCLAEELRCTIIHETGVGLKNLPPGSSWQKLQEDVSLVKKEPVSEKQQALNPVHKFSKNSSSVKLAYPWGGEELPIDIERNMDTVTLFDLLNYNMFIGKPLLGLDSTDQKVSPRKFTRVKKQPVLKMIEPPPLKMLHNNVAGLGPQQVEVMQALSAAIANDFLNCERLETLGDSFLKFAISLTLFETQPEMLEGSLTNLKGVIVGNKNLFYCGKKKDLGSILEVHDFSPKQEWVPPGFCVEHSVQSVLRTAKLNPSCLYNVEIPEEERAAGKLSGATHTLIGDILYEAEDVTQAQNCTFINQQALTDKNISDGVEALLGIYLKNCGIFGALSLLNWFGITNPDLATKEVFTRRSKSPAQSLHDPKRLLQDKAGLEAVLNYKFQDYSFLLQAVTHSSYTRNNITTGYQRLEFLGDAVIDFLITIHIYEKCQTLSPGDLTDLRSALVNNITLSALSVRYQFHKFLLHCSCKLNDCIMRFVRHQENREHLIDNDILFLLEENEVNIAESVDVPKALGDLFEAIIGAVYLDSGKNLNVTWKVVYNLMREEIEKFHKDVPKNHVRMLYESSCAPNFLSHVQADGAVMVAVEIMNKGVISTFNGFGDNKRQAKRAAAKHALRAIRSNSEQ